jgi:hypothetical protein
LAQRFLQQAKRQMQAGELRNNQRRQRDVILLVEWGGGRIAFAARVFGSEISANIVLGRFGGDNSRDRWSVPGQRVNANANRRGRVVLAQRYLKFFESAGFFWALRRETGASPERG